MSLQCGSCGTENRDGLRFCAQCGAALAVVCSACGAELEADDRFCGRCGTPVADAPAAPPAPAARAPSPERRLVSVLFADLVGFTSLSDGRDPEEVRALLERYFARARETVARYGGTVEKFIGDAVMAVWGTPVAREDDAERAVRAALDLVAAVPTLGAEAGTDGLRLRAGVLTGRAAVDVGAEAEGMVIGDAVNTASRIQSVAPPGSVLVDDATHRATSAAIAYQGEGAFELKGKAEPVHTWRALRVVAGVGGKARATALEAPFVGRDAELGALHSAFEEVIDGGPARLVSVIGEAGIGKSRLAWELQKHADGVSAEVLWHRGRCLPYGEGVAFWALAEMVRARAGIAEEEGAATGTAKLAAAVERYVPDPRERRLVEPRLAQLLGLAERGQADRAGVFSAWRAWVERLATARPTVMVFEDIHWADQGLLDFIEHLMEWSGELPLLLVTLARPDLAERRPGWAEGDGAQSVLPLAPLPRSAMVALMDGLVPGLEPDLRDRIAERADGVPLYAVETVRMLLDQGVLERRGDTYVVTGSLDEVAVPETLHALIASRLDALSPAERRLVQDAAVLGKSFTRPALAAVSGLPEDDIQSSLDDLVRKQLIALDDDPLSAERGQYGFLQALVRRVAYETLSRADRRARHLATARHLEQAWGAGAGEIAEVLADHYLEAVRADPSAPDAPELEQRACATLAAAGDRAAGLAAPGEASRSYAQAAELASHESRRAELLESAGRAAWKNAEAERAVDLLAAAVDLYRGAEREADAARARAWVGEIRMYQGRTQEAVEAFEAAVAVLSELEPGPDLAFASGHLGGLWILEGDLDRGEPLCDVALEIAERLRLVDLIAETMVEKGVACLYRRRRETGIALWKHALDLALEHDVSWAALWSYNNLSATAEEQDLTEEALQYTERGLELARQRGERNQELPLLANKVEHLADLGRWEEAIALGETLLEEGDHDWVADRFPALLRLHACRGDEGAAQRVFAAIERREHTRATGEVLRDLARAFMANRRGAHDEALEAALRVLPHDEELVTYSRGLAEALEAAWGLGDRERVRALIDDTLARPPVARSPFMEAEAARFEAKVAAADGDLDRAEQRFRRAAATYLELHWPFWRGVVTLEHAELLIADGRADEATPLAAEAREIFERLGAAPSLERLDALGLPQAAPA